MDAVLFIGGVVCFCVLFYLQYHDDNNASFNGVASAKSEIHQEHMISSRSFCVVILTTFASSLQIPNPWPSCPLNRLDTLRVLSFLR